MERSDDNWPSWYDWKQKKLLKATSSNHNNNNNNNWYIYCESHYIGLSVCYEC